jgi:hypothetical protein
MNDNAYPRKPKPDRRKLLVGQRRLVRVPVDIEVIARQLLRPSGSSRLEVMDGIPPNSIFITAYYSPESQDAFFVFAHELFEKIEFGEVLPVKHLTMEEIDLLRDKETNY